MNRQCNNPSRTSQVGGQQSQIFKIVFLHCCLALLINCYKSYKNKNAGVNKKYF